MLLCKILLVLCILGGEVTFLASFHMVLRPQQKYGGSHNPLSAPVLTTKQLINLVRPGMHPLKLSIVEQNFIQASIVHSLLYTSLRASSQQSLTKEGLVHGAILGTGLWTFLGWRGWLICIAYLVLGSLVTKIKIAEKEVSRLISLYSRKLCCFVRE